MKRIIICLAALLSLSATSAFASPLNSGNTVTNGLGNTIYGGVDGTAAAATTAPVLGRLSKGVQIGVVYDNTAYSLNTKHLTGSKMYGTSFDSTAIYSQDSPSGTAVTAPSVSNSSEYGTGWTAM